MIGAKMIDQEMAHQGLGPVEQGFAGPAGDGQWFSLLLAVREEARAAAPASARENAAIEAEDVLSQADEALVMG